jgi:hypothetical protein
MSKAEAVTKATTRDAGIAKRDAGIAKRDAGIAKRDAGIAKRDVNVAKRDTGIARPALLGLSRRNIRNPVFAALLRTNSRPATN